MPSIYLWKKLRNKEKLKNKEFSKFLSQTNNLTNTTNNTNLKLHLLPKQPKTSKNTSLHNIKLRKTIVFQNMSHIWSQNFYDKVKQNIEKYKKQDFVLFMNE